MPTSLPRDHILSGGDPPDDALAIAAMLEATPVPVQLVEEEAVPIADDRFTPGAWTGIAQLTCVRCPWDTLEGLDAFDAHWSERHAPPRPLPPQPLRPVLFGVNGEPLTSSATQE